MFWAHVPTSSGCRAGLDVWRARTACIWKATAALEGAGLVKFVPLPVGREGAASVSAVTGRCSGNMTCRKSFAWCPDGSHCTLRSCSSSTLGGLATEQRLSSDTLHGAHCSPIAAVSAAKSSSGSVHLLSHRSCRRLIAAEGPSPAGSLDDLGEPFALSQAVPGESKSAGLPADCFNCADRQSRMEARSEHLVHSTSCTYAGAEKLCRLCSRVGAIGRDSITNGVSCRTLWLWHRRHMPSSQSRPAKGSAVSRCHSRSARAADGSSAVCVPKHCGCCQMAGRSRSEGVRSGAKRKMRNQACRSSATASISASTASHASCSAPCWNSCGVPGGCRSLRASSTGHAETLPHFPVTGDKSFRQSVSAAISCEGEPESALTSAALTASCRNGSRGGAAARA
mmetsp:Transcript_8439/g.25321  ORF Transcript_8439/g.25321 Transcript_8439/m.25321 type:complete len:397 (+) Transcript_8439:372-1562(+)